MTWIFIILYTLIPPSFRCFVSSLALFGQVVSKEMSLNIMVIYCNVYSPGLGTDEPWVHFIRIIDIQSYSPFPATNSIEMIFQQFSLCQCIGDLCSPCRKVCHGHHRVVIYINIVELKSSMLHAKFR